MEGKWACFYRIGYLLAYFSNLWRSRHTYSILKNIKCNSSIELGAGTGLMANYLSKKTSVNITLLEKDRLLAERLKMRFPHKEIINTDFFKFKTSRKWGLVYSIGVIEHYQDKQRLDAIKVHKKLSSKYILIAVPTNSVFRKLFLHPLVEYSVGYEKLYNPGELVSEFRQCGLKMIDIKQNILGVTVLAQL